MPSPAKKPAPPRGKMMKICKKLFNAVNFEPACLQPCCDTRALKVPAFPYSGGPVDMRAYAAHIQNVADELQHGGQMCRGCPELLTFDGRQFDAYLAFSSISVNMHRYFCNCKCTYCDLWNQPQKGLGYDILPGIKSLREQDALADGCFVSWGGGEPSILPSFEQTSAYLMDNGYKQYVHTNALRFSPAIAHMLQRHMGGVNISLDSASRPVYQKVKGLDAFETVVENIQKYCENGNNASITLKYIVFEDNNSIVEINSFIHLCQRLNIGQIQYSLNFKEINTGAVSQKTLLAAAFLQARAKKIGLSIRPFFIDEPWLGKINELGAQFARD